MPSFTFTSPEGKNYTVNGPDGATKEQAFQMLQTQLSSKTDAAPQQPPATEGDTGIMGDIKNAAGGFARSGMGIVSNLMRPIDALGVTGSSDAERMARVNQRFGNQGYDQNSLSFKGGKLGGDVLATAPVGGALAKGVEAIPALAKAVPNLAPALASGGFRVAQPAVTTAGKVGNALLRTGAGAAVGGTQAALISPDQAGTGALVGGLMPGGAKLAGVVGKGIRDASGFAARNITGAMTGAGPEAVRTAYQSGKTGNQAFMDNMKGNVSFEDVVDQAKNGLQTMRQNMVDAYKVAKDGSTGWAADTTKLDLAPIQNSFTNALNKYSFKGVLSPGVKDVADKVNTLLDTWKMNAKADPSFATAEGLDALKRQLQDIYPSDQGNRAGRAFLTEVNSSVKKAITDQVPQYASAMKDYWAKSGQLSEIERSLSLGDRAAKDTAVRKLQSLLRNNVSTNFGNRLKSAQALADQGGQDVIPAIAGQSMNSWMPRGMAGAIERVGLPATAILAPKALALAPLTSPRLVGSAAYGMGAGVRNLNNIGAQAAQRLGMTSPGLLSADQQAFLRAFPIAISANP